MKDVGEGATEEDYLGLAFFPPPPQSIRGEQGKHYTDPSLIRVLQLPSPPLKTGGGNEGQNGFNLVFVLYLFF